MLKAFIVLAIYVAYKLVKSGAVAIKLPPADTTAGPAGGAGARIKKFLTEVF